MTPSTIHEACCKIELAGIITGDCIELLLHILTAHIRLSEAVLPTFVKVYGEEEK